MYNCVLYAQRFLVLFGIIGFFLHNLLFILVISSKMYHLSFSFLINVISCYHLVVNLDIDYTDVVYIM